MKNIALLFYFFCGFMATSAFGQTVTITPSPSAAVCAGKDLTLTAMAMGFDNTSQLTYSWNQANGQLSSLNPLQLINIDTMNAGQYIVTVTGMVADSIVFATDTIFITVNQKPSVSITADHDTLTCKNDTIRLTASGGTDYEWSWTIPSGGSGSSQDRSIDVTYMGNYTVNVSNNQGCSASTSKMISEDKSAPQVTIQASVGTITCKKDSTSSTISVFNPNTNWTYEWSTGGTNSSINVTEGDKTYMVTVTGRNGCHTTKSIRINQNGKKPTIDGTKEDAKCKGDSNGTISIDSAPNGFTYSYDWGGGHITKDRTGLSAGTYTVTVTDTTNSCISEKTFTINEPETLTATISGIKEFCAGSKTTLTINPSGGNGGYKYSWGVGGTSQNKEFSESTDVTVTVTDSKGCTDTASTTVTMKDNPEFDFFYKGAKVMDNTIIICPNDTAIISLTPDISYQVNGESITGTNFSRFAGEYTVLGSILINNNTSTCSTEKKIAIKEVIVPKLDIAIGKEAVNDTIQYPFCGNNFSIEFGSVFDKGLGFDQSKPYNWYINNQKISTNTDKQIIQFTKSGEISVKLSGYTKASELLCPVSDSVTYILTFDKQKFKYDSICGGIILPKPGFTIDDYDSNQLEKIQEGIFSLKGKEAIIDYHYSFNNTQCDYKDTINVQSLQSPMITKDTTMAIDACGPFLLAQHKENYCYDWYDISKDPIRLDTDPTHHNSWYKIESLADASKYIAIGRPCGALCDTITEVIISTRSDTNHDGDIGCSTPLQGGGLTIYPNPAAGQMYIRLDGFDPGLHTARIFDTYGRNVATKVLDYFGGHQDFGLDVTGLNDGLYILHCRIGRKDYNIKFIINK